MGDNHKALATPNDTPCGIVFVSDITDVQYVSLAELGIWGLRLCSVIENFLPGQSHYKNMLLLGPSLFNNLSSSQIKLIKDAKTAFFNIRKFKITESAKLCMYISIHVLQYMSEYIYIT